MHFVLGLIKSFLYSNVNYISNLNTLYDITLNTKALMQMFDWLMCYLLKASHQKLDESLKAGKDLFTARNENQVFYSKTLAIVFIEVIRNKYSFQRR